MKNVWKGKINVDGKEVESTVSVPPTLLFSAAAKIDDVSKTVTLGLKRAGDIVYVIGETKNELGGSEYYAYRGEQERGEAYLGNKVPKVDTETARDIYKAVSHATEAGLVHSAHTPTIGGLGIGIVQSAFAGNLGVDIDLSSVPAREAERDDTLLFSESNSRFIVTVPPEKAAQFEEVVSGLAFGRVGRVTEDASITIRGLGGDAIVDIDLTTLKSEWKSAMRDM